MPHPTRPAVSAPATVSGSFRTLLAMAVRRASCIRRAARQAVIQAFGDVRYQVEAARLQVAADAAALAAAGLRRVAPEPLENRQLMSAGSVSFNNGVLTVRADSTHGSNLNVGLSRDGSAITGYFNSGNSAVQSVTEPASAVTSIVLVGGDGADWIHVDNTIARPVTVDSGDGNDTIQGGGADDHITVGDGDAHIQTRGSSSVVVTGDGNSTLSGGGGADSFTVGDGDNIINAGTGNDSVTAGDGDNVINGQNGNDTLVAGDGDNSINGGLGDDSVSTGTGTDTVYPGAGHNVIQIGSDGTTITGTSGKNSVLDADGNLLSGNPVGTPTGTPTGGGNGGGTTTVPVGLDITPAWVTTTATDHVSGGPTAVLESLQPVAMVGAGVTVKGIDSPLGAGSDIDAYYQWNFGDPNGAHNTLDGFNSGHVYDTPGTYPITLTVTNVNGLTSTATATVTVKPDTRNKIYVDAANGNDANDGLTPQTAYKTAARGGSKVRNGSELLFARGQTYDLASAIGLKYSNVLVGAYGTGTQPVINFTVQAANTVLLTTMGAKAVGVTIQDLKLTTLDGVVSGADQLKYRPMAINVGGYSSVVRNVTFGTCEDAMDSVGPPTGLLAFDNTTVKGGIASYFLWATGGRCYTVVGNTVANSRWQHDIRTTQADGLVIEDNTLSNDSGRGVIEFHEGVHGWFDGNTITGGDLRVGPRGGSTEAATSVTADVVIQRNTVYHSEIRVTPGSQHIMIRNNEVTLTSTDDAIDVTGRDGAGRQSADIRIYNNTAVNTTSAGQFLQVFGFIDGLQLVNNLYVSPTMAVGSQGTAPVFVYATDLTGWTKVTNNVWQTPATTTNWAQGGVNFVFTNYAPVGEQTPAEWNALPQVGTDYFATTKLDLATFAPSATSVAATAGQVVAGVYGDLYGDDNRPRSGNWSAGAVQV